MSKKLIKTKTKQKRRKKSLVNQSCGISSYHFKAIITTQSHLVQANFNLDKYMNLVVKQIQKLTPATGAVIELAEGPDMVYRAATGTIKKYLGLKLPIEGSISGLCVRKQTILRSNNTEIDKRVNIEACRKVGARSLIVAPLFYQSKAVGVLKTISKKPNAFSRNDVLTLMLMANLIASGLAHKLFYEALVREQNKLNEAEERFRLLVESSRDYAIFMLDQAGYIKTWNSGAKHMLGFTEQEVLGKQFEIIYPPAAVTDNLPKKHMHLAKSKKRFEEEGLRIKKSGDEFWVDAVITALYDANKKPVGYAVILRDLTESKKLEAIKNEFISVVNHELRTPLTSIRGSLSLLQSGILGRIPDKATNLLNIASKNSERLGRLINDILDVQKLQANKMELHIQPLNLNKLITESVQANQMYAKQLDVGIDSEIPEGEIIVNVDPDRFLQIMANLMSNAIKYSPKNDSIIVQLTTQNNIARVSVIDHGPGIPEEFQSRIFQKFAQANTPTTRQHAGTGLGLNITKTLIEKFNGKIDFTTSDKGTVFYFELPIVENKS